MAARSTGTAQRRVTFDYPADMDPVWTPRRPEFACAANSVSLMMPTVEPYFVRSARAALSRLEQAEQPVGGHDSPSHGRDRVALADEVRRYIFQEAQHHGQHRRFNRILLDRYRHLARLERVVGLAYGTVERRGSERFNSAFAASSETMAFSAARWAAEHRVELFRDADDHASTLFLWHLGEEVEHKSVAFDIYWTCYGDDPLARVRYAGAMLVALILMVISVIVGTTLMLAKERRLLQPMAWIRLTRWAVGFSFELLTNLALSLLPGHHPAKLTDPLWYEVWLAEFDADTATIPIWHSSPGADFDRNGPDGPDNNDPGLPRNGGDPDLLFHDDRPAHRQPQPQDTLTQRRPVQEPLNSQAQGQQSPLSS